MRYAAVRCLLATLVLLVPTVGHAGTPAFLSHPPMRPLPVPSDRPLANGPAYFVDAAKGDDAAAGSQAKPWRTVQHAVGRLQPGDTLYLRGGTFREHVPGTPEQERIYEQQMQILELFTARLENGTSVIIPWANL